MLSSGLCYNDCFNSHTQRHIYHDSYETKPPNENETIFSSFLITPFYGNPGQYINAGDRVLPAGKGPDLSGRFLAALDVPVPLGAFVLVDGLLQQALSLGVDGRQKPE